MPDFHIFGKRAPLGESGLRVVIADLLISTTALGAVSAAAAERYGDSCVRFPATHIGSCSDNDSGQFVSGHVRQVHVGIMSHPTMPVTAAEPTATDRDDGGIGMGNGIGNIPDAEGRLKLFENSSLHEDGLW